MNCPMLGPASVELQVREPERREKTLAYTKIGRIESKTHLAIRSKRSPLSRWIGLSVDFARCLCFAFYHDGVHSERTEPL